MIDTDSNYYSCEEKCDIKERCDSKERCVVSELGHERCGGKLSHVMCRVSDSDPDPVSKNSPEMRKAIMSY